MFFNIIIPICNLNGPDFKYRVNNINEILECIPEDIKVIISEQCIDDNFDKYSEYINYKLHKNTETIRAYYPIFNKSWMINLAAKQSESDYIAIFDSDCIPIDPPKYFKNINNILDKKHKWFWGWNNIKYLSEDRNTTTRNTTPQISMAAGGIIFFEKKFFEDIGMFNELMQELGGMDNEIVLRATHKYPHLEKYPYPIYHLYHPYNKLKEDKWKRAKHRPKNQKIYREVKKDPQKMINFLVKNNSKFSNNKPLCGFIEQ